MNTTRSILALFLMNACQQSVGDDEVGTDDSSDSSDETETTDTDSSDSSDSSDATDESDDSSDSSDATETTDESDSETGNCADAWAEVDCSVAGTCFATLSFADTAVQVFHESEIDGIAGDPPCEPEFSFQFDIMCDANRCYAGTDGWYAPYSCGTPIGLYDWPAWMCEGAAPGIDGQPWDQAGCSNELATSCLGASGIAVFEIWPSCLIPVLTDECDGSLGCACAPGPCNSQVCEPGLVCVDGICSE